MKTYGIILWILSIVALGIAISIHDYFYLILFIALYIFGAITDISITTNIEVKNEHK